MPEPTFDHKAFLKNLTGKPGVYRMYDAEGQVLYVGKAKNLKNRVSSYFRKSGHAPKTRALMKQVVDVQVMVTHTETEALILENTLIKQYQPRYNVLLRDDKSYPYIYLSTDQRYPRLSFHRGARRGKGRYFGPYPSSAAVREALNLLQKLFPVRQCEDSFFSNRSRPCLQYQIKRCTAPCVGLIDEAAYAEDVNHTIMFLQGKDQAIIDQLVERMDSAAAALRYELAARYRDQIGGLRKVQERQYVSGQHGDLDVIAAVVAGGRACVQVFVVRGGHTLGNRGYFPRHPPEAEAGEVMAAFLAQYYLGKTVPSEVLVNHDFDDRALLEQALGEQAGHKVSIVPRPRGERARWLDMALRNADIALRAHLASRASLESRFEALQEALGMDAVPQRLECFDISHTGGEATVASCVVFEPEGAVKSDYRRYNIENITPGDDFAAMRQALLRRYTRLKEGEGKLPDILFIDGGKGQLAQAGEVLDELQIGGFAVIGVAKGVERKPGKETLFLLGSREPFILPADSAALHLIQQVRDEAHRFAIAGHRQRRAKARRTSVLEGIPGLGPKRRQVLLKQFGGLQGVRQAGVEDLATVQGISRQLAQRIYDTFHQDDK